VEAKRNSRPGTDKRSERGDLYRFDLGGRVCLETGVILD
jgi:hypothetical protein